MIVDSSQKPKQLSHRHLMTLELEVDASKSEFVGKTAKGNRAIVPVQGGVFSGERLNGVVQPGGHDWVIHRADGVMEIDVRLTLLTDDQVLIYLNYQGRLVADSEAMQKLREERVLKDSEYSLAMIPKFECGDSKYRWLNDVIAVGTGAQSGFSPRYTIYEIL